jgi:2-polyprenyl-3-methyl-5-hydroxy-6-metoxy-1,4-benzoquinol methylase
MKNFLQMMYALLNSRYYPLVNPWIDLRYRLPRKNIVKSRVLNVGVGDGNSGVARQLPFIPFKSLTMIDVHEPYLKNAKARFWDAKEVSFVKADVRDYPVSDFDIVMMFDVLEHLTKADSLSVLSRIRGTAVVFIPLEKEYRKNVYEVESQDHLSMWTEQDFIDLGFKTEVLHNFHKEDDRVFDALWAIRK